MKSSFDSSFKLSDISAPTIHSDKCRLLDQGLWPIHTSGRANSSLSPTFGFQEIRTLEGINYFSPTGSVLSFPKPEEPLRVLFLTSLRDVAVEEGVGKFANIHGKRRYIKGTIETALEAVADQRLEGFAEIVGIVFDDLEKDVRNTEYALDPLSSQEWIYPLDLLTQSGQSSLDITYHIPSEFRLLPLLDKEGRYYKKLEFESKLFNLMQTLEADVIISDHYLAKIEFLISPDHFGLFGRVLNTHPGITRQGYIYHCRGYHTDEEAINHVLGYATDPDTGEKFCVTPHDRTGACFHIVSESFDQGPILCDAELTPVFLSDKEERQAFVRRIYETSKNPVFLNGLKHYASNVYPAISKLK